MDPHEAWPMMSIDDHGLGVPQSSEVLKALRTRPASVRQVLDRLDRPVHGARRWTRSQVRHQLEALVQRGMARRSRGRLKWTVRYSLTERGESVRDQVRGR